MCWVIYIIAETEGFEPSKAFTLPRFQRGALDHYATSPCVDTVS